MATKESWPEHVGKVGTEVQAAIKKEHPELNVVLQPELSPCTMDFRTDRVRVFINAEGKVTSAPNIG